MAGYTISAVAGRIRKIDSLVNWKLYTALATLARLRGTKKAAVETLVFGKDEKPSKDFNNAWSRAGKVFARFYSGKDNIEAANRVRDMGVEDAETELLRVIDAHMTALGVKGKNAYDERIDYADEAEWKAANAEAEEPAAEEPAAEEPTAPESDGTEPAAPDWDQVMATMCQTIDRMPDDRLAELAQYLQGVMTGRAEQALAQAA